MNPRTRSRAWLRCLGAMALLAVGLAWTLAPGRSVPTPLPTPARVPALLPGTVARMDSPAFRYGPGWQVTPRGADTLEPSDPWQQPAGVMEFTYRGQELALQVAMGDYWGYMYVTVDGAPANRLAQIWGNEDSRGRPAGYKPFLAPERQTPEGPSPTWVRVHRASDPGPHRVRVEVWRSWGQVPLRAVAVDALPPEPGPRWPGVLLLLVGAGGVAAWAMGPIRGAGARLARFGRRMARLRPVLRTPWPAGLAGLGLALAMGGTVLDRWWLADLGLALLAWAGLQRPSLWVAALLLALPLYLVPVPVWPGRAVHFVDPAIWGGLLLVWLHRAVGFPSPALSIGSQGRIPHLLRHPLALLAGVALVAAVDASVPSVAWREWRTVFLAGAGFALLLGAAAQTEADVGAVFRGWMVAWMVGGGLVALVGVVQYLTGWMVVQAEEVARVRAFYGSPNNLALYLERTAVMALALALLARGRRLAWLLLAGIQLLGLALTFSKGALLLGLPAGVAAIGVGGWLALRAQGRSPAPLWTLVGVAAGVAGLLLPFAGTERFQALFDLGPETTGGLRLNLWRSALAMALDHPLWGVGPDNFLYVYRSGYILPAAWWDPNLNHPHNLVLDWWTRLGILGLAVAGLWWGRGLWQRARQVWRGASAWEVGALAAATAGLAHGLIDASYALPDLMLVWVWLLGFREGSSEAAPPGSAR